MVAEKNVGHVFKKFVFFCLAFCTLDLLSLTLHFFIYHRHALAKGALVPSGVARIWCEGGGTKLKENN